MSDFAHRTRFTGNLHPGFPMRRASRTDAVCERCAASIRWNHRRSARDPRTGALQTVCKRCHDRQAHGS